MSELADVLGDLEDPRAVNARRHSLDDILVIVLCAIVCGGQAPCRGAGPARHRHGAFRPFQTGVSGILSETGKRDPRPRHLFHGAGQTGPGSFPQARNRKGHGAENLSLLRKLALNLARLEPSKGSMRGKLKRAGWDNSFLIRILAQFTKIHMR